MTARLIFNHIQQRIDKERKHGGDIQPGKQVILYRIGTQRITDRSITIQKLSGFCSYFFQQLDKKKHMENPIARNFTQTKKVIKGSIQLRLINKNTMLKGLKRVKNEATP